MPSEDMSESLSTVNPAWARPSSALPMPITDKEEPYVGYIGAGTIVLDKSTEGHDMNEEVNCSMEADAIEKKETEEAREELGAHESTAHEASAPGSLGKNRCNVGLQLPIARVKRLVKAEGEVQYLSSEAGVLVARAAELFLELFTEGGYPYMAQESRNTLHYKDLATHVALSERMEFLRDIVPQKVRFDQRPPSLTYDKGSGS